MLKKRTYGTRSKDPAENPYSKDNFINMDSKDFGGEAKRPKKAKNVMSIGAL